MWIRDPFLDHVGRLQNIIVHGHTVVGDLPVVTENRISIDTGAYHSGRLTAVAIDNGSFRFFQTDGSFKSVVDVEPVLLDRGLGTVFDNNMNEYVEIAA
jgi:serine/threonine protein phosphatase 1